MSQPDNVTIADIRENYESRTLRSRDLDSNPFAQFSKWLNEAHSEGVKEVNAMTLATLGVDNIPSTRTVLLKDLDARGFTFFTNYKSRKAREIEAHIGAALTFFWKEMERQVNIRGWVERVTMDESEEYFYSRPYDSRIGAHASNQSEVITDREHLERRDQEMRRRFPETDEIDCVPIPDHWGGYRVLPISIEFWQGGPGRLHDRFTYAKSNQGQWSMARLSP